MSGGLSRAEVAWDNAHIASHALWALINKPGALDAVDLLPSAKEALQEVSDALFALTNDTDMITLKDN